PVSEGQAISKASTLFSSFGKGLMYTKQKQAAWNNMSGSLRKRDTDAWNSRIRAAYWAVGLTAGAILTYTTRYYLNGDGINYIEMGEALRHGWWSGLVNLTESPGYAFLLGLGQIVLNTNRLNELQLLKSVNFVCFMVTSTSIVLWIKENPVPYVKFVLLGVSTAPGYLFKSFFFPFSTIFFVLAGL